MNFKKTISALVVAFAFASLAVAQGKTEDEKLAIVTSVKSAYQSYIQVEPIDSEIPTVVEVEMDLDLVQRLDFAVLNKTTNSFEPYYFREVTLVDEIKITANSDVQVQDIENLSDKNLNTYTNFILPIGGSEGRAVVEFSGAEEITSSGLTLLLDKNVAYPTHIEIRAMIDGEEQIVVAKTPVRGSSINFPQTASKDWKIIFTYSQPLRISELKLKQDNLEKSERYLLRFLAQPASSYEIYFNPDRLEKPEVLEAGKLSSAKDVLVLSELSVLENRSYKIADIDGDGIANVYDNCVSISNPDQEDINNNGLGDVCDDFDQDGVINSRDNCINNPNRFQADEDGDGIGDVCDDEESRLTEKSPWISWVGMGLAIIVLLTLIISMARSNTSTDRENS